MSKTHGTSQICEFCAKIFPNKQNLVQHLQTHSGESKYGGEKVQCDLCGAWLGNKYRLKTHMVIHTAKPVKCDQCDKVAPGPHALYCHIRNVHSEASFKCHLCPKSFRRDTALKVFLRICHVLTRF